MDLINLGIPISRLPRTIRLCLGLFATINSRKKESVCSFLGSSIFENFFSFSLFLFVFSISLFFLSSFLRIGR